MNDIKPVRPTPKRPLGPTPQAPVQPQPLVADQLPSPVVEESPAFAPKPPKSRKKLVLIILGSLLGLILIALASAYFWYQSALQPLSTGDTNKIQVEVGVGTSR